MWASLPGVIPNRGLVNEQHANALICLPTLQLKASYIWVTSRLPKRLADTPGKLLIPTLFIKCNAARRPRIPLPTPCRPLPGPSATAGPGRPVASGSADLQCRWRYCQLPDRGLTSRHGHRWQVEKCSTGMKSCIDNENVISHIPTILKL